MTWERMTHIKPSLTPAQRADALRIAADERDRQGYPPKSLATIWLREKADELDPPRPQYAEQCRAVVNIAGEHFECDLTKDHWPLAHSSKPAQAIWVSDAEHAKLDESGIG